MNEKQTESFARFIARLVELGVITVVTESVEPKQAVSVTGNTKKGNNHDTPSRTLR